MKKILVAVLQIAVTVAVLFWVFHDPQKRAQMAVALRMADYRWIVAALVCYFVVELAAGIRWWILLKVQQIHLSIARVAGLFLIGMFYNQFLPGGTGGDIMKSYLLLKETPGKATGALLAVVFDRMVGLVALISITGVLIALRYDWLTQLQETKHLVWLLVAILSGAVLMLVTSFVVSGFHLAHKLPERFPGREKLIELSAAYHLYARHWRATLAAFGASIVAHLATFGTFLCVAYAFRAPRRGARFFRHHADRAHNLLVADQFRRRRSARENLSNHAPWALRRARSGRGVDRLDELSRHARLERAGRDRLLSL